MRILSSAIFSLLAGTAMADVPRVAVDVAPIHSLVSQVMEGVGTPDLLVEPGASPHGYALRPSQARALQRSDIVFWAGDDLTPWLHDVIEGIAPKAKALALMEEPPTLLLPTRDVAVFVHGHDEDGHDDHDEGGHDDHDEGGHDDHDEDDHEGHEKDEHAEDTHDDHGDGAQDAHVWLDPVNGKLWLQAIAGHLAEADPENAVTYQANATRAIESLDEQIKAINAKLAPHREKTFIVFHDAYQYFEARFGLTASGAIRLSDATAPSAARLAELRDELKEKGVVCAFSEPQFDDGLIKAVAGDQVKLGVLDPMGAKFDLGSQHYSQLMDDLATSIADCLR
ncbi:zinc ABC transporter substrate-binding protein [Actibacterium pelagium]|uniref:High-affinity zinc uptake system protein ZnuA n=1 Tax=Actibacterium pelagium TaxID=2029103 RepID=A0A917AB65_9RHOB|nr:zinc ABC transporter substrate-binding protein [Actibacterium pelagium]GGE39699.1 zinc ABC transporter substrate-binding protein [Actibacterium pelagium]